MNIKHCHPIKMFMIDKLEFGKEVNCMKKTFAFIMVLILLVSMCACNDLRLPSDDKQSQNQENQQTSYIPIDDIVDKIYLYEKEGCGGDFMIEIKADGTFAYYEGMLSSHEGSGEWSYSDGMLTLFEKMHRLNEADEWVQVTKAYSFLVEKDTLVFVDKGLDMGLGNFLYVRVKHGEKFFAQ